MSGFVDNLLDPDRATGLVRGFTRASKRQFDDEPGGGVFDLDTYSPWHDSPGGDAEVPLGPGLDEGTAGDNTTSGIVAAVGRSVDDRAGGGVFEGIQETAEDAAERDGPLADLAAVAAWIMNNGYLVIGVVVLLALLYLFGPVLRIVAGVSD